MNPDLRSRAVFSPSHGPDLVQVDGHVAGRNEAASRPLLGHLLGKCGPASRKQKREHGHHRHSIRSLERFAH